jgi:hypothetical protein
MTDQLSTYLDAASDHLLDGHLWALIGFYRGLLAAELKRTVEAARWFDKTLETPLSGEHSATLRFIASVIATVAWFGTTGPRFRQIAMSILEGGSAMENQSALPPSAADLPALASRLESLNALLLEPRSRATAQGLALLPFNYR